MAHIDAHIGTNTVRRLNFSDGFHWCEYCEDASRNVPATYFIMTLERVDAKPEKVKLV